jgi:hypothetical protein
MAAAMQTVVRVVRERIAYEEDNRWEHHKSVEFTDWSQVFFEVNSWLAAANKVSKEKPHAFDIAGVKCFLGLISAAMKGVSDLADGREIKELESRANEILDPFARPPRRDRRAEERKKKRDARRMANPDEWQIPGKANWIVPLKETSNGGVTIDYERLKERSKEACQ